MKSINPASGTTIHEYREHTPKEVEKIVQDTNRGWQSWRFTDFAFREQLMRNLAAILRSQRDELALIITSEMGKVLRESKAEVEKCAWVCDYYADNAAAFLHDQPIKTNFSESFVTFQPLGIILAVMPWNFPFWQVFRFAAPTLMAGNTAVLKHASNVPGCALAIEGLFREAGFPDNTFRTLLIGGTQVEQVIAHPAVKAVTLTGSAQAGRSVAMHAGVHLKKSLLELGGSDPYIILEDADLENAAGVCATSRLLNAGQSCIAAKRFIVVAPVYEKFKDFFVQKMTEATWGNPLSEEPTIGPLARVNLRDELHLQVTDSLKMGARLIAGGSIPHQAGSFYPPTVLDNILPGMPAFNQELFGPVAALIKAVDETEAINMANDSMFGLGSAIFTNNLQHGKLIAREKINAGSCFVNDFVKSDPRLPFGGIGESGFGRELSSWGIMEFVNIKTVAVK